MIDKVFTRLRHNSSKIGDEPWHNRDTFAIHIVIKNSTSVKNRT